MSGRRAFQTSVAIKVPPFHGLQPRLGLAYSSSAPSGWLGKRWSLAGLSTLRRQAAGDGLPSWDATDTFAIDGRDLVICPPVGDGGPVARSPSCAHRLTGLTAYTFARVEGFQRIAFDPTGDGRWLVWRTDGVKATYEPGVLTSRGVLEWRLSRVEDLSGNAVSYDWTTSQDAQVSVLKTIRYGDVEIRHLQSRNPSCRPAGRQCQ